MGIFKTYREVKHIFNRPTVKVYFGLWKNDPNLPMFRDNRWFYFCNWDVTWKLKYGECRYEFPPQFTIVLFRIALTITLHCPKGNRYCIDDHYWEGILEYLCEDGGTLSDVINTCGYWVRHENDTEATYFSIRPEYIRKEYLEEYYTATDSIRKAKDLIIE